MDTACGRITWRTAWVLVIPSDNALSIWIGSTASRPLRKVSAI